MLVWLIYLLIVVIIIVILLKVLFGLLLVTPFGIHEDTAAISSFVQSVGRPI